MILTETSSRIRIQDLTGTLRPEVVVGNILTITTVEHLSVTIFFL